jgi:hypothetical protein
MIHPTSPHLVANRFGVIEMETVEFGSVVYNARHGGPFDRGSADSYYSRGREPHYYVGDTSMSARIEESEMTPEAIEAYNAGYDYNEQFGDKKNYD